MYRHLFPLCVLAVLPGCVVSGDKQAVLAEPAALQTIRADIAANEIVRIVTPFAEPRVVTRTSAEIERSQNVLYLLATADETITMFVTEAGDESNYVDLTLTPKSEGIRKVDATLPRQAITESWDDRSVASNHQTIVEAVVEPKIEDEPLDPYGKPCRLCRKDDGNDGYGGGDGW